MRAIGSRFPLSVLLLGLGSTLNACGGGGGGAAPAPVTVTLFSLEGVDGIVARSLSGTTTYTVTTSTLGVGDAVSLSYRAFYGFDLSGIPAGATVTSATLRTYQMLVNGTPYAGLGNLLVEHVVLGAALVGDDFDSPAYAPALGALSSSAALGARTLDVTVAVKRDRVLGRALCGLRLRFPALADGNPDEDLAYLVSGVASGGTGEVPTLVVTYTP